MRRDLRIDFIRGLVLLLIVADHVLNNETMWFAFTEWMYFDGAATFVFMSGFVCGMVYSKVMAKSGLVETQIKAAKRAGQLYLAQILVLAIVCALFMAFERFEVLDAGPFGLSAMFEHPEKAVPNALLLMYTPWLLDILKLYIVLLLLLPVMLWLYQRSRLLTLAISFSMYAFAQKFPEISPREYPHGHQWFWNPFAWQLVFFGAAALGLERSRGTLRLPRNAWLTALAVLGMIGVVIICRSHVLGWMWTDRQKLAPMHVISFTLAAYLISGWLKPDWAFWRSRLAAPIIACGRHALAVFCIGVIIDYVVSMVLKPLSSPSAEATVVACGVALTLVCALVLDWYFRERAATPGLPKASVASVDAISNSVASSKRIAVEIPVRAA